MKREDGVTAATKHSKCFALRACGFKSRSSHHIWRVSLIGKATDLKSVEVKLLQVQVLYSPPHALQV